METISGITPTDAKAVEIGVAVAHRLNDEIIPDQTFLQIMQRIPQYQVQVAGMKVENGDDYEKAMKSFAMIKKDAQDLEKLRKEKTAFPLAYKKAIDDLFKTFANPLANLAANVGGKCTTWKAIADKKAEDDAAKSAAEATDQVQDNDGVGTFTPKAEVVEDIQTQLPLQVAPTTITAEDGTKVQARKYTELTVTDKEALIKAILSKNKRLDYLTLDLITVNEPALKRVIEANNKIKKVPGVKIEKKERIQ